MTNNRAHIIRKYGPEIEEMVRAIRKWITESSAEISNEEMLCR